MGEPVAISKILDSEGYKDTKQKGRFSQYDWVELTEDEIEDALGYRRMLKGSSMEEADRRRQEQAKRGRYKDTFTYDQLREHVLSAAKLLPFDFVIDEDNEHVFHLLCLYFSNDPDFDLEEIEYSDGTKRKLSRNKGIGLISSKKGTGKSVLMHLFQNNRRQPYMQIDTKSVSAMYKVKGEEAIIKHSEPLRVPPMPIFNYWEEIGICFDDLGQENLKGNYGDKSDVMVDVISRIYSTRQFFCQNQFADFHFTSNLSGQTFENRYGEMLRDRMREMWNIIIVPGQSRRK
jgi:hypothetical protein